MSITKPEALAEAAVSTRERSESPELAALIERAKGGDADAFAGLVRLHERRVIGLGLQMGLRREDALDACQDAFVKVFRYIRKFDSTRSFQSWLYRVALNAIHDHARRTRQPGVMSLEDLGPSGGTGIQESGPSLGSRVEAADLAGKLLQGLRGLSKRERIVFVLRDLQEMPTDEIGTILRLSRVTVRRHCMSARQKLRDRLFPHRD